MILCDVQTISNNYFDAEYTVEEMCNAALIKGFYAIAITDHCEAPFIKFGYNEEFGDFNERIPLSFLQTKNAQIKYRQKLKVLCGIELGEPMHDPKCTEKALSFGDFDFVLASLHNLKNMEDFCAINEVYGKYFTSKPARSCVAVKQLPKDVLVEVEVIAEV